MVTEKRKLPKDVKPPVSMLQPSAQPAKDKKPAPVEGGIDYGEMLEPLAEEEKPKKKGRGPSPHYQGLINAYLEKEPVSGAAEEFKVNLDRFRAVMGKPDLPVATIRQGLRNNLHKMVDDDGRELWERVQVSVDGRTGMLTLKRRKPKPRSD